MFLPTFLRNILYVILKDSVLLCKIVIPVSSFIAQIHFIQTLEEFQKVLTLQITSPRHRHAVYVRFSLFETHCREGHAIQKIRGSVEDMN